MDYVQKAFLQAVAIIVVLLLVVAYYWWHFTGWVPFEFSGGERPQWKPSDPKKTVAKLRFKDCVFRVWDRGAAAPPTAYDVTPALTTMAVAYTSGNVYNTPKALALDRPLNAFSFTVPGFNDAGTVTDPSAAPWCGAPPTAGAPCWSDGECGGGGRAGDGGLGSCTGWPGLPVRAPSCRTGYDCGPNGVCSSGVCTKGTLSKAEQGSTCRSDFDCNYIVGACQSGTCSDSPGRAGQCKWCSSDSDCGGAPGSCGATFGPDGALISKGTCSICPGAPAVSLAGFVRAI